MRYFLRFLSIALVALCSVSSLSVSAVPTAPVNTTVEVAEPVKKCCSDGKCRQQADPPEGVTCEGQSCDDDSACPVRRCVVSLIIARKEPNGSTGTGAVSIRASTIDNSNGYGGRSVECKVSSTQGIGPCTDENCNYDHPPRCDVDTRKCTLTYTQDQVGTKVRYMCDSDEMCAFAHDELRCDVDGKCKRSAETQYGSDGAPCSKDQDCRDIRVCVGEKCTLGGMGHVFCGVDEDCAESKRFCSPEAKCVESGLGIGSLRKPLQRCYGEADCADKIPYACDTDGKCKPQKEVSDEDAKLCVKGVDSLCSQRVCKKGKCQHSTLSWGIPCSKDEECENLRRCDLGKCVQSDSVNVGNKCANDPEFCSGITHCNKFGQCTARWGGTRSTCNTHADCKGRGYPDFCENNPDAPGCKESKEAEQLSTGIETLSLASPQSDEPKMMGRLSPKALAEQAEKDRSYASSEQAIKPADVLKSLEAVKPSFVWGKPDAKVTLAIFQDLACGQCKRVHRESFAELSKSFIDKGKLKVEFYEFPLIMGEDVARHYGALCAARQGKYTQFLDKVYENFKGYKLADQPKYAKAVKGLDFSKWNQCMKETDVLASTVKAHKDVGASIGVDGTPSLFINGESASNFREDLLANVARLAQ